MSGPLQVRLARPADDAALCALMQGITMPGRMELAVSYDPSFFGAVAVEGDQPDVIVGEQDGRLVGCGLVAGRRVYLNGVPARVGYLSSLRLDPDIRGTTALARGYRFLRILQKQHAPLPFSLSTIMNDNGEAAGLLGSGRAGLPRYVRCGRYITHVLAVGRLRGNHGSAPLRIRKGSEFGPDALCRLLNDWGSRRQFYPVYTAADLTTPGGLLRGLRPEHFLVACDERDQPVGMLACWDLMPFRRYIVTRYHGLLRLLSPLVGLAGRCLGRALLPPAGKAVSCLHVACIATRNDDPAVFEGLLQAALSIARDLHRDYLFVGLAEGDPLADRAHRLAHLRLYSGIYLVGWDLPPDAAATLDGRPLYLELGSL